MDMKFVYYFSFIYSQFSLHTQLYHFHWQCSIKYLQPETELAFGNYA